MKYKGKVYFDSKLGKNLCETQVGVVMSLSLGGWAGGVRCVLQK